MLLTHFETEVVFQLDFNHYQIPILFMTKPLLSLDVLEGDEQDIKVLQCEGDFCFSCFLPLNL